MGQRWPNIVLTGFMGTGKSSVGRALAAKLCYEFVDTDTLIEQRHGPIPDIFANEGESAFRDYEHEVVVELAETDGCVISTGGRLMLEPRNSELLSKDAYVFCLAASVSAIVDRVCKGRVGRRPLLDVPDPAGRIRELLAERADGYGAFTQVDTDNKSPQAVADHIITMLAPGQQGRCAPADAGCADA